MRKLMSVMLAAAIVGSLVGCGAKDSKETTEALTTEAVTATVESNSQEQSGESVTDSTDTEIPVDEKLTQIHQAVKDAYEYYIPDSPYDQDVLSELFGVSPDLYDSFIAEGPSVSINVETFVGIAAKEGKGKEVEAALNKYRDNLVETTFQYPMNIIKIQASQVIRHGDYVFFVMLGAPTQESEEQGEDAALASAQENNQLAVTAIDSFFQE